MTVLVMRGTRTVVVAMLTLLLSVLWGAPLWAEQVRTFEGAFAVADGGVGVVGAAGAAAEAECGCEGNCCDRCTCTCNGVGVQVAQASAEYPYRVYVSVAERGGDGDRLIHTRDSDTCSSCHMTMVSEGMGVYEYYPVYYSCVACHDGTLSTTYNVVAGEIGTTGQRTGGGMFGFGVEEFASSHNVMGRVDIVAAPGGPAGTGEAAADGWRAEFGCQSCHNPHGLGDNPRVLNPNVNGWSWKHRQERYRLTAANEEGTVYVAYPGQNKGETPYYMLSGLGYNITVYVYNEAGEGEIVTPMVDNSLGYTQLVFQVPVYQAFADFYPGLKIDMEVYRPLRNGEEVVYRDGINDFCGACHVDYNTSSAADSGHILTGTYGQAYRHRVGIKESNSDYRFSPMLKYEEKSNGDRELVCLTCHMAHGVDGDYWADTINEETLGRVTDDLMERSGSSALKRLPNEAACEACHRKGEAGGAYVAAAGLDVQSQVKKEYSPSVEDGHYVSAQTCAYCHKARYQEWQETQHARMVGAVLPGDDEAINAAALKQWETSRDLSTYYGNPEDVEFTLGSKWKQMYVFFNGEAGYKVATGRDVVWNVPEGRWEDYRSVEEVVDWDNKCIGCHVTGFNGNTGGGVSFSDYGVGCEACHGPGGRHNDAQGQGYIINPVKLTQSEQVDICGQCHARGENKLHPGREDAYGYIPGQRLEDSFHIFGEDTYFWPDGTAKLSRMQYEDFILSRHFRSGSMTCTTCHDPHRLHETGRPLKLDIRQTCSSCHGEVLDIDRYMPYTAADIKNYDRRTHSFKVDYKYPETLDNPDVDVN